MTKKERYNIIESEHTMPFVYDGDDKLAEVHSDDVERLCGLLNEQNNEIQRLRVMNNELIKAIQRISKDSAETITKLWSW